VTNLKGKPFTLIGMHVGGLDAKGLRQVMDKEKLTWRSFVDRGDASAGPIARKWNLSATPTLYLIDHKGVIRYRWAGAPGEKALEAALGTLIQAAGGNGKESPK
jgi:hypothetical protein